jgi:PAS domain S-box-containing protein
LEEGFGMKENHVTILSGLMRELKPVFDHSSQGVYLYLDDAHLEMNKKFLQMLGYSNMSQIRGNFLDVLVEAKSQKTLATAYRKAVETMRGSTIRVTWKKKNGRPLGTKVILVPITYSGHAFALHFVEE